MYISFVFRSLNRIFALSSRRVCDFSDEMIVAGRSDKGFLNQMAQ